MNDAANDSSLLNNGRVAFIQENGINESMGLCDLSGHLKSRGATTRLFLRREERNLVRDLRRFDPQLVVIPCDLLGHNTALKSALLSKQATSAPVLFGGVHPTFFPNVVLRENVNYAFAGEAEGVVSDLLASINAKQDPSAIPNLIWRKGDAYEANPLRPLVSNLDSMAMPDRDLYYRYPFMASFPAKKFSTGRGCNNSCGFCFNPTYRSMLGSPQGFFRRKSPDRIVREILEVKSRHRLSVIHFSDDLFSSGAEWLESFMDVYRERVKTPYSCNTFASIINEKVIRIMKDGGCRIVAIGLEIADDNLRRSVMNKPVTTAQIVEAARLIRNSGIKLVTFNILGLPWSDIDGDIETLDLNRRIGSDHTRTTILVPFPKSAMARKMVEAKYLSEDFDDRIYEVADIPAWPSDNFYKQRDPDKTARLLRLWPLLLMLRMSKSRMRKLLDTKWSELLSPLGTIISLVNEKKIFGFGWLDGFRYFLHVKSPGLKTSNYVSFI